MIDIRRRLGRLLLYIAAVELMVVLFFAFTIFARSGYHPAMAWHAALAAAGCSYSTRRPQGVNFDRSSLELALIWSVFSGVMAAFILGFAIYAERALRDIPHPAAGGDAGPRHRGRQPPERSLSPDDGSLPARSEISFTLEARPASWSGIYAAMMVVCLTLGFASLATILLSCLGHPPGEDVYWVGWVVAMSLAVGFGARFPPGVDTARIRSRFYIKAYLKVAPLWLRILLLAAGLLLAIMCVRTGYIALYRPGAFNGTILTDNYAAAVAFIFFVDALAFFPFPKTETEHH